MTDLSRLGVIAGVVAAATGGWSLTGYPGLLFGVILGACCLVLPWRRLPLWVWAALYLGRNRRIELAELVTVANDRSGGGLRYQDDVAIVAVQLLGKRYQPTCFTGSTATETANKAWG
jgi:hypothetical protein